MSMTRIGIALIVLLSFIPSSLALADGFRNPFHDSAAMGQGNAFRAQADNPSAVFYNPAGMTQLPGIQHSFGVQFISPNVTYRSTTGEKVENDIGGAVGFPPPGQFFLTANLADTDIGFLQPFSLGFGLLNLYGFANEYPKDGPFAGAITRGQLPLIALKPTIGMKITDSISIGVGADIFTFASFLGEGHQEQQSIALGNIPGTTAGDELELNGKGTTTGMNASLLVTALRHDNGQPMVNLGFIWRSQAVLPLKGKLLANGAVVANAKTSLRFPESYELALAVWPLRNDQREWKVEADVDFVRWSSIRNFDVSLSNGATIPNPQQWSDAVTVYVGTEYRLLGTTDYPDWDYAFRIGGNRSESPIPDHNFNPAFADAVVYGFATGVGFFCDGQGQFLWIVNCESEEPGFLSRKGMGIDLMYFGLRFNERRVSGHAFPAVNGRYKTITHSGGFTLRVIF